MKLSAQEALEYGSGWQVKGVTDDVTTCEHCGRRGLKRTVAMVPLDADGNPDGDAAYFGTGCAVGYVHAGSIRGKVTGARIVDAARAAMRQEEERRIWAGEVLAKYEHAAHFDPIQKRALYESYNPESWRFGTDGAAEVDALLARANAAMEPLDEERRAELIELGRKTLDLAPR
ncbi:hypothetical protein AB0O47_40445 [Streptomyces noursei]|uniref:hypothetical protein n=1 Tax=Streptomyces noursei TaxID=1971 RepID=UPI00344C7D89